MLYVYDSSGKVSAAEARLLLAHRYLGLPT